MQREGGENFEGVKKSHSWAGDSGFQKKIIKNCRQMQKFRGGGKFELRHCIS